MAVNTKDKYYTPEWLVKHTVKKAVEIIGKENITDIIEPSAGDGAFIEELDKLAKELGVNVGYYDLYPSHPRIIKMDYKKLIKSYKKGRLIIGNPPFGTSSSLWKAFCKKSAKIGDFIAFVSPASQYKSNYYFKEGELIYSELLNDVEYRGDEEYGGKDQKVRTCLNIYKVYDREEEEDWRIARLEQDILIKSVFTTGDFRNKDFDADFYVGSWGWGCLGKYEDNKVYAAQLGIKILDESKREQITDFFKTYRENNITDEYVDGKHLSIEKVKQQLIKLLYPTREERLEQDVHFIYKNISRDGIYKDADFYITTFREHIEIYEECPKNGVAWAVKSLNIPKDKLYNALCNLKKEYKCDYGITIQKDLLIKLLMKYLYPTREERLEQDVLWKEVRKPSLKTGISRNLDFECDFYMGSWGAGPIGKITTIPTYQTSLGIKILNESKRKQIEEFFYSYKEKYVDTGIQNKRNIGGVWIDWSFLKEHLIKHLYPTREERLEQDISFSGNSNTGKTGQYYICQMGDAGFVCKEHRWASEYTININNEDIRQKFEQSFDLIKELIQKHTATGVSSGGSKHTNLNVVKEVLMNVLYPQDNPQFEDYDYPEVRKPVHVERAVHGKPLIPIEYREEIVKTPKEETKVAAVALF